jgi:hypothetical protein
VAAVNLILVQQQHRLIWHLEYGSVFDLAIGEEGSLQIGPANVLELHEVGLAGISDY